MKRRSFVLIRILALLLIGCQTVCEAEENRTGPGTSPVETTPLQLVMVDGTFIVFKTLYPENHFGVTFEAANVAPTGMTLICTRADALTNWQVITGSPYGISLLTDGTWKGYQRTVCGRFLDGGSLADRPWRNI